MTKVFFALALIASFVVSESAYAFDQYAFWTGRSERATTMNYQSGYNCEYKVADGRTFWRFFTSSCPSQVQL